MLHAPEPAAAQPHVPMGRPKNRPLAAIHVECDERIPHEQLRPGSVQARRAQLQRRRAEERRGGARRSRAARLLRRLPPAVARLGGVQGGFARLAGRVRWVWLLPLRHDERVRLRMERDGAVLPRPWLRVPRHTAVRLPPPGALLHAESVPVASPPPSVACRGSALSAARMHLSPPGTCQLPASCLAQSFPRDFVFNRCAQTDFKGGSSVKFQSASLQQMLALNPADIFGKASCT